MKYAYFESPLPYVNMRKIDAIDFKALAYHLCSMHILLEFTLEHGKWLDLNTKWTKVSLLLYFNFWVNEHN